MAWTTPRTWVTNELVTAAMLNTHIRDNLNYLLNPNGFFTSSTGTFTTSSATPVTVNAALSTTITTYGGDILLGCSFRLESGATTDVFIAHDGGNDLRVVRVGVVNGYYAATVLKKGIAAGSHSFQLRWNISSTTATMRGIDGGGFVAAPIIFWAIEI